MFCKPFILLMVLVTFGCAKENECNFTKGTNDSATFQTSPFTTLIIKGRVEVELIQSNEHKVEFFAGENLLPNMYFDQSNDTVTIDDKVRCSWLRNRSEPELKCKVYVDTLTEIMAMGFGRVVSESTLNFQSLKIQTWDSSSDFDFDFKGEKLALINHTGPSNFKISGQTNHLEVYSGGNGIVDCVDLMCNEAFVNHQGTGDFNLVANNAAFVEIGWVGNVALYGTPTILEVNDYGAGELKLK